MTCNLFIGGPGAPFLSSGRRWPARWVGTCSGRAALWCLCQVLKISRLAVPDWWCPDAARYLEERGVTLRRYVLDDRLGFCDDGDEPLLAVHWFGLKSPFEVEARRTVIHDCTLDFFAPPDLIAFRSTRKFFPVPDGGFACLPEGEIPPALPPGRSSRGWAALFALAEEGRKGAAAWMAWEECLAGRYSAMSALTESALAALPLQGEPERRYRLYRRYEQALDGINRFPLQGADGDAPWCYPLLVPNLLLRRRLLDAGAVLPRLWPELGLKRGRLTELCSRFLLPLPLTRDMTARRVDELCDLILKICKKI